MPLFCAVYGCSNRGNREKDARFFRVPKVVVHKGEKCRKLTEQRRKKWILNLRLRSGGAESPNARVCDRHFVRGCPSSLADVESVDWAPTLNLGYQATKPKSEASLKREQRMKLKEEKQSECAAAVLEIGSDENSLIFMRYKRKRRDETPSSCPGDGDRSTQTSVSSDDTPTSASSNDCGMEPCTGKDPQARESHCQQARERLAHDTDMPVPESISHLNAVLKDHDYIYHSSPGERVSPALKIQQLEVQILTLQHEIWQKTQKPLIFKFCVTDDDYRYYTRFSSKKVFTVFWESVYPSASRLVFWSKAQRAVEPMVSSQRKLELIDELFMFLCRVAAGLQEKTLSSLFEVSVTTVSRIILTWTNYLYQLLGSLPSWMTRDQIQATTPDKLKLYCPQLRVIVDCTEIHCGTASSLSLHSETFSSYTNHTTFKGLIGVAPCGVITFVSKLHSGSISDIEMTKKSQLLQLLQPGDEVMDDKGFLSEKMLSEVGVKLITPSFKTSTQLSKQDTQKTQAFARLRVQVERAIRRVKEYHIWDGLVPLSMVESVNQLWTVCCMMSNFQEL